MKHRVLYRLFIKRFIPSVDVFCYCHFSRKFVQTAKNCVLCDCFWRATVILYGVFGIIVARPSVTDVLWLTLRAYKNFYTHKLLCVLKLDMQNFSNLVQGEQQHMEIRLTSFTLGW